MDGRWFISHGSTSLGFDHWEEILLRMRRVRNGLKTTFIVEREPENDEYILGSMDMEGRFFLEVRRHESDGYHHWETKRDNFREIEVLVHEYVMGRDPVADGWKDVTEDFRF